MKYIREFRDQTAAKKLSDQIHLDTDDTKLVFMEVCGTHTMSIARYGIRELLPDSISLLSGPGCPVCVTPHRTIDHAIALARRKDVIVATFGDMMKVPGSTSSLDAEHATGAAVQVVTSTLDALKIADKYTDKKVVFIGVGFETTIPTVAISLLEARSRCLNNYFVLCAHKIIPPALDALSRGDVAIDGYICPGHVSTIIGYECYKKIVKQYGIGCVISGFEPLDILQTIHRLVKQKKNNKPVFENQYTRAVKPEGNPQARAVMQTVYEVTDSEWRGLGVLPSSGLKIRPEFQSWDAAVQIPVDIEPTIEPAGCLCGEVLQGKVRPFECPLFNKTCNPDHPVGACMVSSEGTCAAYYKYNIRL